MDNINYQNVNVTEAITMETQIKKLKVIQTTIEELSMEFKSIVDEMVNTSNGNMVVVPKKWTIEEINQNFKYILDPSEEICINAVCSDYKNIHYIKNLSKDLIMKILKRDPYVIQEIVDIATYDMWEFVIKSNGYCIKFHPNPPESLQMTAILGKGRGIFIQYIKQPTQEVCTQAIMNGARLRQIWDVNRADDLIVEAYLQDNKYWDLGLYNFEKDKYIKILKRQGCIEDTPRSVSKGRFNLIKRNSDKRESSGLFKCKKSSKSGIFEDEYEYTTKEK